MIRWNEINGLLVCILSHCISFQLLARYIQVNKEFHTAKCRNIWTALTTDLLLCSCRNFALFRYIIYCLYKSNLKVITPKSDTVASFATIYLETVDIHITYRYFYDWPTYQILHTRSQRIINYSIRRKSKGNFRRTVMLYYLTQKYYLKKCLICLRQFRMHKYTNS